MHKIVRFLLFKMPFKLLVFIAELESLFYEFFPGTKQENGRQSVDQGTDTRPYETAGTEEIERQADAYQTGQRVESPENGLAVDIEFVVHLIYEECIGIRCDIGVRHECNRKRSDKSPLLIAPEKLAYKPDYSITNQIK